VDLFNTLFPQSDDEAKDQNASPKKGNVSPSTNPAGQGKTASKSRSAYRTISEAAKDIGVATHVLRFWEGKFPEIQPMKRSNGRRYYKPEDVILLKNIRILLHDKGFTIKGVQKSLKDGSFEAMLNGLSNKKPESFEPSPRNLTSKEVASIANAVETTPAVCSEKRFILAELKKIKDILSDGGF